MELSYPEKQLMLRDAALGELIEQHGHIEQAFRADYFWSLVRSIVSQQLSVKAAATIMGRLEALTPLTPQKLSQCDDEQLRAVGLSRQKVRYLRAVVAHFLDQPEVFEHLDALSDDEIIQKLTQITGIGVWTAQMFLLSTLGRPDVFAPGDRGLQLAVEKLDNRQEPYSLTQLAERATIWAPYRSTASLHLWKSLNNTPLA